LFDKHGFFLRRVPINAKHERYATLTNAEICLMPEFDIVIKDGMIIDGTRAPRIRGAENDFRIFPPCPWFPNVSLQQPRAIFD
jgi:hypothetical protein